MKKRIVLFLLAIFAVFGVSACKNDPYAKMKLTVTETEVNLALREIDKEIVSDGSASVGVVVEAPDGVSSDIVLPTFGDGEYGDEFVSIKKSVLDDGNFKLELTARKQGYTEIQIKTQEGYLSETISVNIDVALDSLSFKENANVVIELGASYDFNIYGKNILNFYPSYTTQTNVRFEFPSNKTNTYKNRASLINNVLTVFPNAGTEDLEVIVVSLDNESIYVDNRSALKVKVITPLVLTGVDSEGNNVLSTTLVDVAENGNNIKINQIASESSASNVYYQLTFANPNIDGATPDMELKTIFGGQLQFEINRTDYKISYDGNGNDSVDIANGDVYKDLIYRKSFVIDAKDTGNYTAVFKVDYVGDTDNGQYDGLYTKYINVRISVVALPTSKTILINDKNYIEGQNIVAVYDSYVAGVGSRLHIASTNNSDMTFKFASISEASVSFNGNPATAGTTYPSGTTLYLKNISGSTLTKDFKVTLTVDVSNECYDNHFTDKQTYSTVITIPLNLISGLSELVIENRELDIVADAQGVVLHEFNEGVIASSVVSSVRYGNSSLFSYSFGEGDDSNKIYIYPSKYTPGDETLNEGTTTLVVYLTNGVRSYNSQLGNEDTTITVKATYTVNGSNPVVITNLDDTNEGFLAYGSYGTDGLGVDQPFVADNTHIVTDPSGVQYKHFENLILSTNTRITLDLYKLFIYQNEQGKSEIGYVNANKLRVTPTIVDESGKTVDASHLAQWYKGNLVVYGTTTYRSSAGAHVPVVLSVYDEGTKILDIYLYICRRVGQVALHQQHFNLFDGTIDGGYRSLNSIYIDKASSNLVWKVWPVGANGRLEDPLTGDQIIPGEFGNFYQFFKLIGEEESVNNTYSDILRKHLIHLVDNKTIEAKLDGVSLSYGTTLDQILKQIYKSKQNFTFDGRVKQYTQEFATQFTVSVELANRSSALVTGVDSVLGAYFESELDAGGQPVEKSYTFNYALFPNLITFRDMFVNVEQPNGNNATVVMYANEYKQDLDGNFILKNGRKIPVYRIYDGGFNEEVFKTPVMFDGTNYVKAIYDETTGEFEGYETINYIIDDKTKIQPDWFFVEISTSQIIVTTRNNTAGTYTVTVGTIDSYNGTEMRVYDNFNFFIANGSFGAPYQIRSTKDFENFLTIRNRTLTNKYFVLSADVYLTKTLNNTTEYDKDNHVTYYDAFLNTTLNNYLTGKFDPKQDGNYYKRTIYGLNIVLTNIEANKNIGLFTDLADGIVVTDLSLENISINVTATKNNIDLNIGGIVGKLTKGNLINCKVNGNILTRVEGSEDASGNQINIGGIVGSYTDGVIIGIPDEGISVNNSDINSTIRIEYMSNTKANLGGVAGRVVGATLMDVRAISNIVSKNLSGTDYSESNIGGIAGYAGSSAVINNAISYPSVIGYSNIGGIVGYVGSSTIKNSQVQTLYNINMKNVIAGYTNVGGIVGAVESDKTVVIDYSYVRSYTNKEISPYLSDRQNINFYLDYSMKYYGSVVALNNESIAEQNIGGIVGYGKVEVKNSNFTANLVSFDPSANFGGIVGKKRESLRITASYVDAKILYYDELNKQFYNSFNIITVPESRTQTVKNSTPITTYSYSGTLNSNKNSYLTIVRTTQYNNSIVEYTETLTGSGETVEIKEFYAKVNNTLFGIEQATTTKSMLSYRGFADKVEKLTLIVYNVKSAMTTQEQLRMYARNETYENTPSGAVYSESILGGSSIESWSSNDATKMQTYDTSLAQELVALGIYKDDVRYYKSSNNAITGSYSKDNIATDATARELFGKVGYSTTKTVIDPTSGEGVTTNLTYNELLENVALDCTTLVSSNVDDNQNEFTTVKTITADISNIKFFRQGYSFEFEDAPNTVEVTVLPEIAVKVDDETFTFRKNGDFYQRINLTWEDSSIKKSDFFLLTEGVVRLEKNGYTYTYTDSNGDECVCDVYTEISGDNNTQYDYLYDNAESKAFRLVKVSDAEYDSKKSTIVAQKESDRESYQIMESVKFMKISTGQMIAMGKTQVIYLDSKLSINDEGRVKDDNGEEKYVIVGENIYDLEGNKVESDLNNYYTYSYGLAFNVGSVTVTNDKIANLYEKDSLETLFKDNGFNYVNGEILVKHNETDYYLSGNSWYLDDTYQEEIVVKDLEDYSDEDLKALLDSLEIDYETSATREDLIALLPYNQINLEQEKNKIILNQLAESKENTEYDAIKIAYYFYDEDEVDINKRDKWYYDANLDNQITDNAILSQLAGRYENSVYYDRETANYVSNSNWEYYYLNNNLNSLVSLSDEALSTFVKGHVNVASVCYWEIPFSKNGENWDYDNGTSWVSTTDTSLKSYLNSFGTNNVTVRVYASKWTKNDGSYITDYNLLSLLNGKEANTEYDKKSTAYYRNNWYTDIDYTNRVFDSSIIESLNEKYANYSNDISKNTEKQTIVVGGKKFEIPAGNIATNYSQIITNLNSGFEGTDFEGLFNKGNAQEYIGIAIIDNMVYITYDFKTGVNYTDKEYSIIIDKLNISGKTHYVIGKTLLSANITTTNKSVWLVTNKINDNLAVSLKHNYNLSLLYNGSYSNGTLIPSYKLYFDELASISLRANEFESSDEDDFIYIDGEGNKEHGHLKLDDNSVVLMYNKLSSGVSDGTENTYQLAFGEQDGHFVATLNGVVVELSGVEIDTENALQLMVSSSNSSVVAIERQGTSNNFDVIVKGLGNAQLNFYNLKDDSIKATLNVYTIKGFTNFEIFDVSGGELGDEESIDLIVGGDTLDYAFKFVNHIHTDQEFEANNGGFKLKLKSIDGKVNAEEFDSDPKHKYSAIKINNITIDKSAFSQNRLEFTFDNSNLSFVAINQDNMSPNGSMLFEVIPYIMCNGQQIFVEDLKKEIEIEISNPAQIISFSETNNMQLPEEEKSVTVIMYSNYSDESLILKIEGADWGTTYYDESEDRVIDKIYYAFKKSDVGTPSGFVEKTTNTDKRFNGSLLKFRLNSVSDPEEVILNDVKLYQYTYTFVFSMNTEEYRIRTSATGRNPLASSVTYSFTAYPSTHFNMDYEWLVDGNGDYILDGNGDLQKDLTKKIWLSPKADAISSNYKLTINPVNASSMETNFYPYLKPYIGDVPYTGTVPNDSIDGYALEQIYDIRTLPPGSYGLLKIEINPKFNNTLILEVSIPKEYIGYITFKQIVSAPYMNYDKPGEDAFDGTYGYYKKLSAHLTNNDINVTNTSILWDVPYATNDPEDDSQIAEWVFSEYYLVAYISPKCPENVDIPVSIKAFDDNRKQTLSDVVSIHVEPVPFVTVKIDNQKSLVSGINEYLPIQIDSRNIEKNSLGIKTNGLDLFTFDGKQYKKYEPKTTTEDGFSIIDPSVQYYVYTGDLKNRKIGAYTIEVSTSKDINGKTISSSDTASLQIVWFTIERVKEVDEINGTVTMRTGMYKAFGVEIEVNDGFMKILEEVEDLILTSPTPIDDGYKINGMTPKEYLQSIVDEISGTKENDKSYWYYYNNGNYTHLSSVGGGQLYDSFVFTRYEGDGNEFYRISAIQPANLSFRLSFNYGFTGGIMFTDDEAIINGYALDYDFNIVIKANSTEDNPIPIYNAQDLMDMEKDVNYILQSDITLTNWKPMNFDAAYLDGNGFVITITSFDMSDFIGSEEVYAGLFTRISENSIVKNLTINIANLLYNDNALVRVRNGENKPNIDLREIPVVHFGILAGENNGVVINTKVVNMDSRKSGNTLYVAITRDYFTFGGEKTLSQGYVGTLVAQNGGSITNTFVGQNKNEKIERTVIIGSGNTFSSGESYIHPFTIESCNNVGGMSYANFGTITNSYVKSVSITNNARISDNSSTAGFVSANSGSIYTSAVSTNEIVDFKSSDTLIKSASVSSGFVNINSGTIEDCYTNIQIENRNVETAGFVHDNSEGSIKNCYTTSKNTSIQTGNGNTHSHGLFVYNKSNYGIIDNSLYLVFDNELGSEIDDADEDAEILRSLDPAIAIIKDSGENVSREEFNGFGFATSPTTYDGAWHLSDTSKFPELSYAENVDYFTIRSLVNIEDTNFEITKDGNDVSVEVYTGTGASKEVNATYDDIENRTTSWYFTHESKIFEVVGNRITDITSDSPMDVSVSRANMEINASKEGLESCIMFDFSRDVVEGSVNYRWEYRIIFEDAPSVSVYTINITKKKLSDNSTVSTTSTTISNYTFNYMGFEFSVIVDSGVISKLLYNNGFNIVSVNNNSGVFEFKGNSTYSYMYVKNNLGSKYNPLIVTDAEDFAKYIVNNTNEYVLSNTERAYIFGLAENTGNSAYARYVHIANNINFRDENNETDKNIAAKYELYNSTTKITINDVIFNGVLIGNSMSINNIILNSTQTRENYGIFNEVGVNDALRHELVKAGIITATNITTANVSNLKLNYLELSNTSANKVGLLAGTISNAVINKIDIEGVEQVGDESRIIGQNLVGSLAGLIYGSDNKTKVSEITASNVNVLSTVNQLSNIDESTVANDQSYSAFRDKAGATATEVKQLEFASYTDSSNTVQNSIRVVANLKNPTTAPSYAGAIAGAIVIDAEVDNGLKQSQLDNYSSYKKLRELSIEKFLISDLTVKNAVNVQADMAGGIAGYIGSQKTGAISGDTKEYATFAYNLHLELSQAAQQSIYGYVYAGGIVGQTNNAYFMEAKVGHEQSVQDEIDKKINSITSTDVGSSYLFSKEMDDTKYNVAIGGIVGRMSNTWIVDSYSKANVENKNSFIAGGVVGFATGNGYLSYTYTTGNVLAKNIIGGLVGYYYMGANTATAADDDALAYNLSLYNTFAVNIWNVSIKDLLKVNEKAYKYTLMIQDSEDGTPTLKENVDLSQLTPEQLEFSTIPTFNSMPELGNQQISAASKGVSAEGYIAVDNTFIGFASYERFTFIGSVIGRVSKFTKNDHQELLEDINFISDSDFTDLYSTTNDDEDSLEEMIGRIYPSASGDDEEYYTYFNAHNFNVISSTYGGVEHDGSISEGDYESIIAEDKINLSYFKSVFENTYNEAMATTETEDDFTPVEGYDFFNIDNFKPMFGKQYYISYITGDFINNSTDKGVGNKYYENEFASYYAFTYKVEKTQSPGVGWGSTAASLGLTADEMPQNGDLYLSKTTLDKLDDEISLPIGNAGRINNSLKNGIVGMGLTGSNIWYIPRDCALPKYGHNSNETFGLVKDEESLTEALTSGQPGMVYRIEENDDHDGSCSNATGAQSDKTIYHVKANTLGDKIISLNNTFFFAPTPVTVKLKPEQGKNIFNNISGCTFMNITFEIDMSGQDSSSPLITENIDRYLGFFANVVTNSVFTNCNFNIVNSKALSVQTTTGSQGPESMGMLIGFANNTMFNGCNSTISGTTTITAPGTLINFGGFAGNTWQSTFVNFDFTNNSAMTISFNCAGDDTDHAFGGFIGKAQSTRIDTDVNISTYFSALSSSQTLSRTYNIGTLIGHAKDDTRITNVNIATNASSSYTLTATSYAGTLNAGVVGFAEAVAQLSGITVTNTPNIAATNISVNHGVFGKMQARSAGITISGLTRTNAGTVAVTHGGSENILTINVGSLIGEKSISNTVIIDKSVNYSNIAVTATENSAYLALNVGGFVGRTSGLRVRQSANLGNVTITNKHESGTTNFGGLVGMNSSGTINIENSINYGDQIFKLTNNANYRVGGLVGNMGGKNLNISYTLALGNIINNVGNNAVVSKNSINGFATGYRYLTSIYSHYVAEHDPRHAYNSASDKGSELNYKIGNLDESYAWHYIDFYKTVTSNTKIVTVEGTEDCLVMWKSSAKLPVIDGLTLSLPTTSGSKFNPKTYLLEEGTNYLSVGVGQYAIIPETTLPGGINNIPNGAIITSASKTGVDVNLGDYHIGTNLGTISNIKFKHTTNLDDLKIINNNYGNLMNVGFYDSASLTTTGLTATAPVVNNYGGLYGVGSMMQIRPGSVLTADSQLSFLVQTNNATGEIAECYTTNTLTTTCTGSVKFGAIAYTNNGYIQNVYAANSIMIYPDSSTQVHDKTKLQCSGGNGLVYTAGDGSTLKGGNVSKTLQASKDGTGSITGNKTPGQIKEMAAENGVLSRHLWSQAPSGINSGYPIINGGIQLTMTFVDGEVITSIERLNDWLGSAQAGSTNVYIDIKEIISGGEDTVRGTITTNISDKTITIRNLYTNSGTIKFIQTFVTTNEGTITTDSSAKVSRIEFNGASSGQYLVAKNSGTATLTNFDTSITFSDSYGVIGENDASKTATLSFKKVTVDGTFIGSNNGTADVSLENTNFAGYLATANNSGATINLNMTSAKYENGFMSANAGTINIKKYTTMKEGLIISGSNTGTISFTSDVTDDIKTDITLGSNTGTVSFYNTSNVSGNLSLGANANLIVANTGMFKGDVLMSSNATGAYFRPTLGLSGNVIISGNNSGTLVFAGGVPVTSDEISMVNNLGKILFKDCPEAADYAVRGTSISLTGSNNGIIAVDSEVITLDGTTLGMTDGTPKEVDDYDGKDDTWYSEQTDKCARLYDVEISMVDNGASDDDEAYITGLKLEKGEINIANNNYGYIGVNTTESLGKISGANFAVSINKTNFGTMQNLDISNGSFMLDTNSGTIDTLGLVKSNFVIYTQNASGATIEDVAIQQGAFTVPENNGIIKTSSSITWTNTETLITTNGGTIEGLTFTGDKGYLTVVTNGSSTNSSAKIDNIKSTASKIIVSTNYGTVSNIVLQGGGKVDYLAGEGVIGENKSSGTIDTLTIEGISLAGPIIAGTSSGSYFYGTLKGDITINQVELNTSNLNARVGLLIGQTGSVDLFDDTDEVKITNSELNCSALGSTGGTKAIGLLAGYLGGTNKLDKITVETSSVYVDHNGIVDTGGIIGWLAGTLECSVAMDNTSKIDSYNESGSYGVGGLVGYQTGNLKITTDTVAPIITIHMNSENKNIGGIIGDFVSGSIGKEGGTIVSGATIELDGARATEVGGVIGSSGGSAYGTFGFNGVIQTNGNINIYSGGTLSGWKTMSTLFGFSTTSSDGVDNGSDPDAKHMYNIEKDSNYYSEAPDSEWADYSLNAYFAACADFDLGVGMIYGSGSFSGTISSSYEGQINGLDGVYIDVVEMRMVVTTSVNRGSYPGIAIFANKYEASFSSSIRGYGIRIASSSLGGKTFHPSGEGAKTTGEWQLTARSEQYLANFSAATPLNVKSTGKTSSEGWSNITPNTQTSDNTATDCWYATVGSVEELDDLFGGDNRNKKETYNVSKMQINC